MPQRSRTVLDTYIDQTDHLKERVVAIERDIQHLCDAIEKTNRTIELTSNEISDVNKMMESGFAEIRKALQEAEIREHNRVEEFYQRIENVSKEVLLAHRVSWPLVISIIFAVLAVGGVGVSFVNMSLSPVIKDIERISTNVEKHENADGHLNTVRILAEQQAKISELEKRINYSHIADKNNDE